MFAALIAEIKPSSRDEVANLILIALFIEARIVPIRVPFLG